MPPLIECCVRSITESQRQQLDATDGAVRVAPCLEHCGTCRHEPFVLVDGDCYAGDACARTLAALGGDGE